MVVKKIRVSPDPEGVAITPDGTQVYVSFSSASRLPYGAMYPIKRRGRDAWGSR
jgi:hypothetical protein